MGRDRRVTEGRQRTVFGGGAICHLRRGSLIGGPADRSGIGRDAARGDVADFGNFGRVGGSNRSAGGEGEIGRRADLPCGVGRERSVVVGCSRCESRHDYGMGRDRRRVKSGQSAVPTFPRSL